MSSECLGVAGGEAGRGLCSTSAAGRARINDRSKCGEKKEFSRWSRKGRGKRDSAGYIANYVELEQPRASEVMCSMDEARLAGGGRGNDNACSRARYDCYSGSKVRKGGQSVTRLAGAGETFPRAWRPRH